MPEDLTLLLLRKRVTKQLLWILLHHGITDLKREIRKLWGITRVKVVPVVFGALGAVSKRWDTRLDKLGLPLISAEKTALLGTAMILRKVLER